MLSNDLKEKLDEYYPKLSKLTTGFNCSDIKFCVQESIFILINRLNLDYEKSLIN